MHLTERAEHLAQLQQELQLARKQREVAAQFAREAQDDSYAEESFQRRDALIREARTWRAAAESASARVGELSRQVEELSGPVVTAEQCAAVDDTHSFSGVTA